MNIRIDGLVFDRANYDADGDVLYLARGESNEAADAALTPEGHGVRYGDDGQVPIGICVNQMGNHIVAVSVYVFLTRVMKVELLQDVSFAACGKSAPRSVVHLDGVAVVDNAQWNRVVVKFESSETRSCCTFYVDGRLPFANCARGVGGVQLAPVFRALMTCVTPVRGLLRGQ